MTSFTQMEMTVEPACTAEELQQVLSAAAACLRAQVDTSPALAAPRLTSLRERLTEIAEELDWLHAAVVPVKD